ncbi:5'-adenylylsulfate reductase-like, variant 2 [Dionaea muscipula]
MSQVNKECCTTAIEYQQLNTQRTKREKKKMRSRGSGFVGLIVVLLVLSERIAFAQPASGSPTTGSCPTGTLIDWILGFPNSSCDAFDGRESPNAVAVIEGSEISLQKVLQMVHSRSHGYAAILFYASWCPFSRAFKPTFSTFSSLYPSIPHFAIEESTIRPSILSKYGVHGFPTLFLLNSTMRIRYGGSRSFNSLLSFYSGVTGIKSDPLLRIPLNNTKCPSNRTEGEDSEQENCPFSWARSPENLLCQENYLALATTFVLLRLMCLCFPYLLELARFTRRNHMQNARIQRLWEHLLAHLNQVAHLVNCLSVTCRRSNLQGGALDAPTWASKSLASAVAIGDASSSRGWAIGEKH